MNYGYPIRRVAKVHEVAYSVLQRGIAADGEIKTRSEAHENDMTLTIAEEEAPEEWFLHMHRRGYPTRLDLLRSMACAIAVLRHDRSGNLIGPNLDLVGKKWYRRFLSRRPVLSTMYSRGLKTEP